MNGISVNKSVSEDMIRKSLYSYAHSVDEISEELGVYQKIYAQKYGVYEINVDKNDDEIHCQLVQNDNNFDCFVPMEYKNIETDVYAYGNVQFDSIELMAISFKDDFPWCNGAFVAVYWGVPKGDDVPESIENEPQILIQYYLPIRPTGKPPQNTIGYGDKYMTISPDMYTNGFKSAPWAKYAISVLYENESIVSKFSKKVKLEKPDYNILLLN